MSLAFDTCIMIDILRGRRADNRERLLGLAGAGTPLFLSSLVVHELYQGVFASAFATEQSVRVTKLIDIFQREAWTVADAVRAAALRVHLKKMGTPIGPIDVLIAGQALERGWTLVTSNVREFERVPGLALEDWSA
ncbi:MAG TPA: type II toxin-antitoxin system VapC family toxin [Caulobacter sp.]|nr:type II toxin-antitoxin system VapC family toxin [Caulobacter sp.]